MSTSLATRSRPDGWPAMHQRWSGLVFLHWRLEPAAVRPLVPADLQLDLFDGAAWVGATAFTVSRMRPSFLPPVPGWSDAQEINLRTYVRSGRLPGVWFFSLDVTHAFAAWAGRAGWHLPYFRARMRVERNGADTSFTAERTDRRGPPAAFHAEWRVGGTLSNAQIGSLEYFLVERYVLFSKSDGALWQARIHHRPWPLREVGIRRIETSLLEAHGLRPHDPAPLAHAQALSFDVAGWWPKRVRTN